MSQKRKRGLQRSLADIVEKQTAPVEDKSQLSRGLIGKFADNKDTSVTPATLRTQSTEGSQPIAPARDYMKVANSINRTAMRQGLFKGKSKQIYDYLYQRTRGAILPVRSVQASRKEIMRGAGIGSDKTIRENLMHLRGVGLIEWSEEIGAHGGNTYTVYLPEETSATQSTQATQGNLGQNLPRVPTVESTQSTQGLSVDEIATFTDPKTSFKTKDQDDDERARSIGQIFMEMEREVTGANKSTLDQWTKLKGVLLGELKSVAARSTVNSASAILAEHLTRRFAKPGASPRTGKRTVATEPAPLAPEEIAPPAAEEVEEYERLRAELEGE